MPVVKIKGHDIHVIVVRDSASRRAILYRNNILTLLRKFGVPEDDVKIELENVPTKKIKAVVSWYLDGRHLYYSYNGCSKFVENLYVILKVLEAEINEVLSKEKSLQEFIHDFSEDSDVLKKREEAREVLGVSADADLDEINKKYRSLVKDAHPDMPNGSHDKFKKINAAHKLLKKELE